MKQNETSKSLGKRIANVLHYTEGFLLCVLTLLLVSDVLLGIITRYVHFNIVFATELGQYLFIWLGLVGVSAAARDKQHVRFNLVSSLFGRYRKYSWMLSQLLFLSFTLFFTYWGSQLTLFHLHTNKTAIGFESPMFIFTAAIPVAFGLTSIRLVLDLRNILIKHEEEPWFGENSNFILLQTEEDE